MKRHSFQYDKRSVVLCAYRFIGCILAVVFAACLLTPDVAKATGLRGMAVVNTSSLNIRASASSTARVVKTLSRGDVVKVASDAGPWCNVVTSGGQSGWCQSAYLANYPGSAAPSNTAKLDWPSEDISLSASFTVTQCMKDMDEIVARFPGKARLETIGLSLMGNPIKAIVIGNPDAKVRIMVQAAMHAREWLTALLALRHAETTLKAAELGATYKGTSIRKMLEQMEIWIIPEANPDGVRLCMEGLASVPASMPELKSSLLSMNGGSTSFIRWKANGRGVDLNRNFDAGWRVDPNYRKPGPYYYGGPRAFSEPESIALRDLTNAKDFALTVSYHSSGEVLYWYNHTGAGNKAGRYIAEQIRAANGYTVLSPSSQAPGGGYRDWFAQEYGRPGFTLEMGSGYCPLPQGNFYEYWQDNRFVLYELMWAAMPRNLATYPRVNYPRVTYKTTWR